MKDGRPYINAEIHENKLEIVDIPPNNYQGNGYGSMMMEMVQSTCT